MGEGGGGSGEGGSRRGPASFALHPTSLCKSVFGAAALWVSHFPRFQANASRSLALEPCTMSGIER